ncbi:UNVERIFIED_ORG: methyl-accepting chemotaxis protein [Pseudomonas parafulva]|nr:methyl-accepting chemotaxis protein [Pseudomonas parafulva]
MPETTTRMPISGLTSGSYTMGVAALGPLARSGEATITVDVNGPPMPETCAVQATIDTITLIPGNTLHGLNGGTYEYFWSPDPAATQGEFLGRGLSITHTGLSFAKSYAYFVRSKNAYGVSAFLKVVAATSMDVGAILEGIKGKITDSELGKELTSRIDLIDKNGPGSVNERVGTAKTELAKQISDVNNALGTVKGNLEQQITEVGSAVSSAKTDLEKQIAAVSALAGSLPYRKDKAYSVGQSALGSDGKLYQALKAVPLNTPPPNAGYWTDIGQAVVTANGLSARVQEIGLSVEDLGESFSAQADQITGLKTTLDTTADNASAAQKAAQDAATLAGGKGKVIVQSAAPAVADRLAQNLWIDTTGSANTPKRWSGSAWVAVTDKVATDAAAAAKSALDQVGKKADATLVNSLKTRVDDAEGVLSSQATKLDGMQTSIDGKASSEALQQVSSQVSETEKRNDEQDRQLFSQSQALTSLNDSLIGKANASAVQALDNRVTDTENALTSQSSDITQLKNSVGAAQPFVAGRAWEFTGSTQGWAAMTAGSTFTPGPLFATAFKSISLQCSFSPFVAGAENPYLRIRLRRRNTTRSTAAMYWANEDGGLAEARRFNWPINTSSGDWQDIELDLSGHAGWNAKKISTIRLDMLNSSDTSGEIDIAYIAVGRRSVSASAQAVSSLSNVVTEAGEKLTSQGQSITSLQGDLRTTNDNVTAAQRAAQNAANTAGAKGEVIYGSAAPAADKRLPQNLWIDTTGGANSPKRWSGTAWQAVTDKVAVDAAAAAANALNKVESKADASTVDTLVNKVDKQGEAITASGEAITGINASLTQVGGENLLFNPSFDIASASNPGLADGWGWRKTATVIVIPTLRDADLGAEGKCQRLDISGLTAGSGSTYVDFVPSAASPDVRPPVYEGVINTASVFVRGNTGLMAQIYLQYKDAAGATLSTDGPANLVLTPSYQRLSLTSNPAPANAVKMDVLFRLRSSPGSSLTGGFVDLDKAQLELGKIATGWRDNGKANSAIAAANASATTALAGRVLKTEEGLTSASNQLTQLDNSLGDVGGENLFYNPGFTKAASSNGSAEGWETEGPVTTTDTLVTSWMNSGEKAQRIVAPGLTNSAQYKSLRPSAARRIKVSSGQAVTASVYARKSDSDIGMRVFTQWINTAGAVISAPASELIPLTIAGARVAFSAVAPSGASEAYVYFRLYAMTATATNGTVELARPQAEYGTRATGWKDNGQVNAANNAATSSAVSGLSSAVDQHGKDLTSVSGRTLTLENTVNSTANGLATKASASAVETLANRVTDVEGANTTQSGSITQLTNTLDSIQGVLGASGLDPAPNCLWQFDTSTEGWVAAGATLAQGAGFIKITATGSDPQLQSGTAATLAIAGSLYSRLRARITRRAGAVTDWDGQLFYQTSGHGFASSYRAVAANPNLAVGQSAVVEWDMANLAAGGADWLSSTITRLRLDLGATSGGAFDVDWIAVGRVAPAASSRAVESLTSEVTQNGKDLSAQAKQLLDLNTSVGDANAAIQNEAKTRSDAVGSLSQQIQNTQSSVGETKAAVQQVSKAQADLDGKVNATWSVKLGLTSGGSYYATGFGLGLENQGGTFQSSFVVLANRFSVLNPVGEGLVNIFTAENGQVVMNDALISKLTVQRAIVGSSINSSELANDGTPIMRMDFASGTLILLNKAATAYTVYNRRGIDMVINGVRRIRMGEWD